MISQRERERERESEQKSKKMLCAFEKLSFPENARVLA